MTGDVRHLLGGYATGTLTPEEHAALMQAALEDQELFDALADDEALRRYLADPAFRKDLLKATASRPKRTPWIAGLALAAAGLIAGLFWIGSHRETALVQIADTRQPVIAPAIPIPETKVPIPAPAQPTRRSKTPSQPEAKKEEPAPPVPTAATIAGQLGANASAAESRATPAPVNTFAPSPAAFAPRALRTDALAKAAIASRPAIAAQITSVDAAIITIKAGATAGVKVGDRFDILHEGSPIGFITITAVEPDFSAGKYTGDKTPEVGDTAITPKK